MGKPNNFLLALEAKDKKKKIVPNPSDPVYFAEDGMKQMGGAQSHNHNGHENCGHEPKLANEMRFVSGFGNSPISAHISYDEATRSSTAQKHGIANDPNPEQLANMKVLAERVFEPIRAHFNRPIYISSFFRNPEVNRLVGGSSTSDHMTGRSMDIDMDGQQGITNAEIFHYIKDNLTFDQLIWEKGNESNPSWVHVSYREGNNRGEVLRYDGKDYTPFSSSKSISNSWTGGASTMFSDPYPRIKSTKFKAILPTILKHEGGFVNDPDDPGGATNKGITFNTFKAHAKTVLGVEPTLDNLKSITDEDAGLIYEVIYWNKIMGEDIDDVQVAYQYVDFYINAGSNAIRTMQRALNAMGKELKVDGGMGNLTLGAINSVDPETLFNTFRTKRIEFYEDLAKRKPKMAKFLKGWKNRANSFVYSKDKVSEGKSYSDEFGISTFSSEMAYSFKDKLFRTDLSGNSGSRVHNRWVKKGVLSSYASTYQTNFNSWFMKLFGPGPVFPSLTDVQARIQSPVFVLSDAERNEMRKKLYYAHIYAIIDTLDVENDNLYAAGGGDTFCNIYAYDVVTGLGRYLPRVWWYSNVETDIISGAVTPDTIHPTLKKAYKNIYANGILSEQSANMLNEWFDRIGGPYFGWEKTTDMKKAQEAANDGHIVIISAKKSPGHGHINVILPELSDSPVKNGDLPLQSQAGASNFKIKRANAWWNTNSHTNGAAWIYKGEIKSPILTANTLGGAYIPTI